MTKFIFIVCLVVLLSGCNKSVEVGKISQTTPISTPISINGGFEAEGSCSGIWDIPSLSCPTSYFGYQPDATNTDLGLKTIHGNNILSAKINKASGYTRAGVTQSVANVTEGEVYRFSILFKTIDFTGQSRLIITEKDENNLPRTTHEVYGPSQSSAWQKLEIVRAVPANTSSFEFTVMTSTNFADEYCSTDCGEVQYDNFLIEKIPSAVTPYEKLVNACDDNYFLSAKTMECLPLTKNFGFSQSDYDNSEKSLVINHSTLECNQSAFENAINTLKVNGGGTLNLPDCTIEISSHILLPDNITIQGAGIGKTIIHAPKWQSTEISMLHIEHSSGSVYSRPEVENVIIRDLSFTRDKAIADKTLSYLFISDSQNILVERVGFDGGTRSNISFNRSQKITLRYIVSQGASWHGIGTKDCFPDSSLDSDHNGLISKDECEAIAGGSHLYWSEDISLYSNLILENEGMGIDSHANKVEIAGNDFIDNGYGSKFPEPATDLWIHDNLFIGNTRHGSASKTQYCGTIDTSMLSSNHVYYKNSYLNNSSTFNDFAFRVDNVVNVILLENEQYLNNGKILSNDYNKARIGEYCNDPVAPFSSTVFYCDGDIIGEGVWAATPLPTELPSSDSRCDINNVSNIFN